MCVSRSISTNGTAHKRGGHHIYRHIHQIQRRDLSHTHPKMFNHHETGKYKNWESFTAQTGRARHVNRWTYGPWIDTFGNPELLIGAAKLARENGIPASALWAEDWIGKEVALGGEHLTYDWEEDPELYPDIPGLAAELHGMGFKFLTYINPMVASDTQVFAEGVEAGFLASDEAGEPIELEFPFGEPPAYYDMTVEGSLDWFWGYLGRAADKGIDGWMHDYG